MITDQGIFSLLGAQLYSGVVFHCHPATQLYRGREGGQCAGDTQVSPTWPLSCPEEHGSAASDQGSLIVLGQEPLVTFWSVAKCALCCGASIINQQIKGSLTFVGWFSLQPHTPWTH